jgi:hypothetical protein
MKNFIPMTQMKRGKLCGGKNPIGFAAKEFIGNEKNALFCMHF